MSEKLSIFKRFFNYFNELQTEQSKHLGKNGFIYSLILLGSAQLIFLFLIILLSALTFAFHQSLSSLQIILAFFLTIFLSYLGTKSYFPKSYFIVAPLLMVISIAVFIGSCYFAGQFYDLSYDGQSYHQDIINQLASGWNPFFEHIPKTQFPTADIANYYPKTAEIYETALYKLTNHIEYSKAFNFTLAYSALSLTLGLFLSLKRINNWLAVALSFLLIFNPVAITQVFSFYIDGQVYQLILCLLSLATLIYYEKNSFPLVPFFGTIALLVTIKITALVYTGVFVGVLLSFGWYSEKIHLSTRVFLTSITASVLAFFIIGFNPFLTNAYFYGHPLHPALGAHALDYVQINGPQNFQNKPSIYLLFYSIFSESDFLKGEGRFASLKPPLLVTEREKQAFLSTDPIEGGFGPPFSAAVILTIVLFIFAALFKRNRLTKLTLLFTLLILFTCALNAADFYVRFIPQFWIIPVLAVMLGYSLKSFTTRLLAGLILGILILNNLLLVQINWGYNFKASTEVKQELQQIASVSRKEPLEVNFGIFRSNRVRFAEAGVKFVEKDNLDCTDKRRLLGKYITESVIVTCTTPYL